MRNTKEYWLKLFKVQFVRSSLFSTLGSIGEDMFIQADFDKKVI